MTTNDGLTAHARNIQPVPKSDHGVMAEKALYLNAMGLGADLAVSHMMSNNVQQLIKMNLQHFKIVFFFLVFKLFFFKSKLIKCLQNLNVKNKN